MLCSAFSAAIHGIDGYIVGIEADSSARSAKPVLEGTGAGGYALTFAARRAEVNDACPPIARHSTANDARRGDRPHDNL